MRKKAENEANSLKVVFLPRKTTYAAVIDKNNNEIEITEDMVVQACEFMDSHQVYPFYQVSRLH